MSSAFVLQYVQAVVPVGDVYQSIGGDQDIGGFCRERNFGAWIDQLFGRRRHPVGDFLGRECVLDIEDADAGDGVGRENRLLAAKRTWPVFVQVVRADSSESAEVPLFGRGQS